MFGLGSDLQQRSAAGAKQVRLDVDCFLNRTFRVCTGALARRFVVVSPPTTFDVGWNGFASSPPVAMTMNGFGAFVRPANPNYLEHALERRGGEVDRVYGSWLAVLVEVTHRVIVQPPVRHRKVRSNMRDRPRVDDGHAASSPIGALGRLRFRLGHIEIIT